ncbi:MAG: hypothetical protein ACE5I3_13905, partial [Phycisphaerae bacterium]
MAEVEAAPLELTRPGTPVGEEIAAPERRIVGPSVQVRRVRRLLRSTSGSQTAFVLSEILAPPVGLRD